MSFTQREFFLNDLLYLNERSADNEIKTGKANNDFIPNWLRYLLSGIAWGKKPQENSEERHPKENKKQYPTFVATLSHPIYMPHFTRRLATEQGNLNFYFNRLYTAAGERYHVSVMDRGPNLQTFYMQELFGRWVLIKEEETPAWIVGLEKTLGEQIVNH